MLQFEALTKTYTPVSRWLRPMVRVAARESVEALRSVSFHVAPGELVALAGPNGAGKTTLIKVAGALLPPTGGRAVVDGIDVTTDPRGARARLGLVLPDERGLYWRLTGRQNLEFFGVLAGLSRPAARRRAGALLERVGLDDDRKLVFGYSSGQRGRLSLARALLTDPKVLLLDEPTRSLDPVSAAQVVRLLGDLAAEGRAILLSSHRLDELDAACQRMVVLVEGTVRYTGPPLGLGESSPTRAAMLEALMQPAADR